MKLIFDKNSLEFSDRKVITSVISTMPAEGVFFPEENWNDSIVVVLYSWLENILIIRNGEYSEAQFVFFDGPFSFKIRRASQKYTIELLQGPKQVSVLNLDFKEFASNLLQLSKAILEEAKSRGWESDDLQQLSLSLKKTRHYLES